ncbi:MAG: AraC family transcriptional regulator ligand-binding domain-containing protein [Pseudoruegeria sp.]
MKRAVCVTDAAMEAVPNYWLRSLQTSHHIDPQHFERALQDAGVGPDQLNVPGSMIPLLDEISVVESLARQNDDPLFALRLGLTVRANTGSMLSYILFASTNLEMGLSNICEFTRLTRPRSRLDLVRAPTVTEFRMSHPEPQVQRASSYREFVLGNILNSLSAATRTNLTPDCVYVAVPIGKRAQQIGAVLGCRVEDAKGYSGIVLKSASLDLPISSSDEHLLDHLTGYGRMLLDQRRPERTTIREKVFQFLMREVPLGVPRVVDAAQTLAMSERTLARRLADEGTTYRAVVDETRATMAAALLDDPSVSVTEVSYLLGFSDPGSFSTAYRRWNGHPPADGRQRRRLTA